MRILFADFELDESNALLLRDGQPVSLAPTPFNLLCALARQPGVLLSKDALLDTVWGHRFVSDSVLKTAISDLRVALGDSPREPRVIETVSRRGYRFVSQVRAATAVQPAPVPGVATASPGFIGRGDTMARLAQAWGRAQAGQRAVVWIAGEPGIGKTTLIEQFVEGLGPVTCARGQCVEHHGSAEPYLPVLEALADLCRSDPALPALLRSVAPTWLLQLPWLSSAEERDVLRRELAGVGPDRMLREMGELLDRYTEQRTLLLITEDLHWSDRATIQLIDHVARRRGRARLMWLASFRVAEVVALDHPLNPLRRELRLHGLCDELVLDAFSEAEVADYVARRSPSLAHNESFVRALHERTDGVPLFVSSMIGEVLGREGDAQPVESRVASVAVPDNLAAIIDHYLARLDASKRDLLATAAVCGVEFRVQTLALALGAEFSQLAQACEDLQRGNVWLVQPRSFDDGDAMEPRHAFRHALFRQVLYERTPAWTRVQRHGQVGEALETERARGVPVAASELAMHFDRARRPDRALAYFAEAAQSALLNFNPNVCFSLCERALDLLLQVPEGPERDGLEVTLATLQGVSAFHARGVGAEATSAFERAYALLERTPEHPMRGRLLHGFGYLLSLRGEYARSLAVARHAETLARGADDPALSLAACLVHGHTSHMLGDTQAASAWIERGLAMAQSLGPQASAIFATDPTVALQGMLAIERISGGQLAQGRQLAQLARARALELRQPMSRLVAKWQEALVEVRLGQVRRLAALAQDMQALVDEYALAQGRSACLWFRGWAEARLGQAREGHRLIREAYELNTRLGMRAGASEVLGYAAEALWLAGDHGAARAELEQAMAIADELGERVYRPQLLLLAAALAREAGCGREAAAHTRQALREAQDQHAPWLALQALVALCAHADPTPDERRALADLIDRLPEAADTDLVQRGLRLIASQRD